MIKKGNVVKSKAGHDKGQFFVVLSTEGEFANIADGKHRMLANPKRKNKKHLAPTLELLDLDGILSDKQLRVALRAVRDNQTETEGECELG